MSIDKLSLSYPGWELDFQAAERIFINHSTCDRFQEKLIGMRTKQRVHERNRSHPHLRTLDASLFDYRGHERDKEEAERILTGECTVFQLGSYNAFYNKMMKKQTLSCDRSSNSCLQELDMAHFTYPGWNQDKAMTEKLLVDYVSPSRFYERFQAMLNKQRIYENDRSHPQIIELDKTVFSYSNWNLDKQEFLQRHTGDCSIIQLGVSCDFLFQKMLKKQQIHNDRSSYDALNEMDAFPFTYPDYLKDKQTAEAYFVNFSSTNSFHAKFRSMKIKQRIHDGDRSDPHIVRLDSLRCTYDGWQLDKQEAERRMAGDCTVLQLGTFDAVLTKMKKLQELHEENGKDRPGLGDLDALLPVNNACAGKGKCDTGIPATEVRTDEKGCVVCFEKPRSHAFVPCGHLCVCETCAPRFANSCTGTISCPLCRQEVRVVTRIFL